MKFWKRLGLFVFLAVPNLQGQQAITTVALSNNSTTTGLSSGTIIGTLSAAMNPAAPVFSYTGTNLHLSTTGADSGGVCNSTNGAGNGSFQVINGDTLATNGTLTSGSKSICVAAAEAGVSANGRVFTIAVGNRIDAAATYCAGNGGGDGTTGNPWHSACINAAIAAAANGDTIFLAAGNWTLSTAEAPVVVTKALNFVGVGSGNTFDAMGHPNNPGPTNLTATPGGSITAIRSSGANLANDCTKGGFIWLEGTNDNMSHIYFDGTTGSTGLSACALPTYNSNTGPGVLDDVRALQMADSSYGPSSEGRISANIAQSITVKNSIINNPKDIQNPTRCMSAAFQMSSVTGFSLINSYLYHMVWNAIDVENGVMNGSVMFMQDDICTDSVLLTGLGPDGTGIGPGATSTSGDGLGDGTYHINVSNSLFQSAGHYFGLGTGINDPTTNGGISDINYTGNWVISSNISLDSCANHYYDPGHWTLNTFNTNYNNCAPRDPNGGGMQVNATWQPWLNCATASTSDPPNRDNVSAGYGINYVNNSAIGTPGSSATFGSVTGAAQLVATGTGIVPCKNANSTITNHIGTTVNFRAHQNYLSGSSANRYVSDADTINPSVTGNFCTGGGGTFTQTDSTTCATTGFTTLPTASFTLGPLGNGGIVPFTATNFTAQYGAVKWIASTSSTTPTSGDSRWSYTPPFTLAAVHGNTVYLWTMDSAQQISSAAIALIP